MTFGLLYAFAENFILPISHDEVAHGKGSVVGKMPGDEWQRFANARAYYGFMWGHPGKKLLFMGQEFGQTNEWNCDEALPWWLLGFCRTRASGVGGDLNRLYRETPASMHATASRKGSAGSSSTTTCSRSWVPAHGGTAIRRSRSFALHRRSAPKLPHRIATSWTLARSAQHDASLYGGSNVQYGRRRREPLPLHGFHASAALTLPPLATLFLIYEAR